MRKDVLKRGGEGREQFLWKQRGHKSGICPAIGRDQQTEPGTAEVPAGTPGNTGTCPPRTHAPRERACPTPGGTSPAAARVRGAAAPPPGTGFSGALQASALLPGRDSPRAPGGPTRGRAGMCVQQGAVGPARRHGPHTPGRRARGTRPTGPAEACAPGPPPPKAPLPSQPPPGSRCPLPARSAPGAPGPPGRSRRAAGAGG